MILTGVARLGPVPARMPLVAVARLTNHTGDSALNSVGDMATDDIMRQLAQSGGITVVDLRAADNRRQPAEVARALGARQMVDGRMYRRGESLHVQMQIVDPRDGRVVHHLDPVVVPEVNAYTVLDLLRDRVGGAVAALTDTVYQPWSRAHSRPPTYAAFREFMLGLHAVVYVGMDSALVHLTKAVQLDTSFVEAKIWLLEQANPGSAGENVAFSDSIAAAAERQRESLSEFDRLSLDRVMAFRAGHWEDVYRAARQLVAVAPETQDAQVYLVHAAMATRRYSEVISTFHHMDRSRGWLKDLRLVSDFDLQAHRLRGEFETAAAEWRREWNTSSKTFSGCVLGLQQLATTGREAAVDSLFVECEQLQDAPAMTAAAYELAGRWYRAAGHVGPARRSFERSLVRRIDAAKTDPRKRRGVGLVQCELEDWPAAHASLLAAADTTDPDDRVALAIAAAHVGDSATVRRTLEWLDRLPERGKTFGREKMSRAFVFVALGRRDEAFILLREAIAEGMAPPFQRWRNRFELAPLRGDPAFEALVQERR